MKPPLSTRQRLLEFDNVCSRRLWVAEKPGLLRSCAVLFAHSGDSWFWGLGLALVWLFGVHAWKLRAVWMLVGIFVTAVFVFVIKFSVRRSRPVGNWGNIYRRTDPHSFPSGHAARAAMLAVSSLLLGPTWFSAILIIWAPLVMLARVAMGVHYLSDVVAGALLGVGIGGIFLWITPQLTFLS
jgi:undecaprenyl-diphosphatase